MREKKVGVAVVLDDQKRFLLVYNKNWKSYAFPMTDVGPDEDVFPSTTIRALADDLGRPLPEAKAKELVYVGKIGKSGSTGEDTHYDYFAYEVSPGEPLELEDVTDSSSPRYLAFDEFVFPKVSWSTIEIARAFVENQEVALGIITRLSATETEYLLVWNDNYGGYFFPAARVKQELKADAVARAMVRSDLGFRGELAITIEAEVPDVHFSNRFNRNRAYKFYVCKAAIPSLDLNQPLNYLERKLNARGCQFRWVTAAQLRTPVEPVSNTLEAVLATVLQAVPPVTRGKPLRRSEGGIALIRRKVNGHTEWLGQWNDHWRAFFFIGGHRRQTEGFRDCVIREASEELGLEPNEFEVAGAATAELEYVAYSQSAEVETSYVMKLFDVNLLSAGGRRRIEANSMNHWLTERELGRLEAFDGRPVSVTMPMLLAKAGLLDWGGA